MLILPNFLKLSESAQKEIVDKFLESYYKQATDKKQVAKDIGISVSLCDYFIKNYSTRELKNIRSHLSNIKTNGENYRQVLAQKSAETCLRKYGVKAPAQNESIREKAKQTNKERYGVEYPIQLEEFKEKRKETCIERFGVEHSAQSKDVIEKRKQTFLDKYGVTCSLHNPEIAEKVKATMQERYGVDYYLASKEAIEKTKATNLRKRGVTSNNYLHIPEESVEILNNKGLFTQFIENIEPKYRSRVYIAKLLKVSSSCIDQHVNMYGLSDIVNGHISGFENEIYDFVSMYVTAIRHDRKILYPKELDIYIPASKLAIECNGNYWHSDKFLDKNYHKNKSKEAENKGIYIYHIFEYDWNDSIKQEIIKSQILYKLNKLQNRLYARNCEVDIISAEESAKFLNNNHLQGNRQSSVKLGLIHEGEIVAVMTFGKSYLSKNSYEWELYRFCVKNYMNIPGAFSKLFSYFVSVYNPENILTFSDISTGSGGIYSKMGFTLLCETAPNYKWAHSNTNEVKSRYQCQMKNENIIMRENNYMKIYDCGNKKWLWSK